MSLDLLLAVRHRDHLMAQGAAAALYRPDRVFYADLIIAQAGIYAVEEETGQPAGPASLRLRPHRWRDGALVPARPGVALLRQRYAADAHRIAIVLPALPAAKIAAVAAELGESTAEHAARIVALAMAAARQAEGGEGCTPFRPRHWRPARIVEGMELVP